ncbi:MAG: RlpA-like double-psi beta-barrel domain-containing protein, partial [Bacteroidota bacterium]
VGQQLVVSGSRPAASGAPTTLVRRQEWDIDRTTVPADLVHFVEPGETLYSIAAAYGFSLDALVAQNAVTTAPLVPGTMLVLPERVDPGATLRTDLADADASGLALVFPDVLRGRATASGEAYDPLGFTASHRELPFGTVVLVTNPATGRSTFVRIADRGPVSQAYLMELSAAAASALGLDPDSAARVEVRRLP